MTGKTNLACMMTDSDRASTETASALRQAHSEFLRLVEPHRSDLWRYCRGLCRTPWDAEDLLQDTLARAYSKLPLLWEAVSLPHYLRRMAKNCWLDSLRRKNNSAEESLTESMLDSTLDPQGDPLAIRALFQDILGRLSARQTATLLYSVAGLSGAEIGSRLGMSAGAVRVELSRARARLASQDSGEPPRPTPLLDRFVSAYNNRDIAALGSLLDEHVEAHIVGVAEEAGRQTVLENSIADDFSKGGLWAEVAHLLGEELVLVSQGDELVQAMRFETTSTQITDIWTYYFCPELLDEVSVMTGRSARDNGYYFDPAASA